MKKVQILQEIEWSSMVSSGKEYLCIEEIDKGTYLIDFRYRETIGEFDQLFDKHMLELEQNMAKNSFKIYMILARQRIEIKFQRN